MTTALTTRIGSVLGETGLRILRIVGVLIIGGALGLLFAGVSVLSFGAIADLLSPFSSMTSPGPLGPVGDALSILKDAGVIGGFALGFMLAAAVIYRRRPLSFMTRAPRFRWSLVLAGLIVFTSLQLTAIGFTVGFSAEHNPFRLYSTLLEALIFCLAAMAFYAPSVLGEEILFRSWVLSDDTNINKRNMIVVVLSSLLFCVAHLQSDMFIMTMHFLSGAAYAWAVVRLGGLEFAFGAHLAKNTVLAATIGLPGQHDWGGEFFMAATINMMASVILIVVVEIIRLISIQPRASARAVSS